MYAIRSYYEAERLAFPGGNPIQVERGGAAYRLEKDPASGQPTLV